eukprot:TRINITY_DN2675_c1_g1_i1.p1 TRINITY_DN2675_c1_g1~~TRINITY_DN2675_c1_g1_i1.p1  ORF type:complete len:581 (+),score=141.93 TRINITY_DN2675_c1_g1_i1:73-1815(+)
MEEVRVLTVTAQSIPASYLKVGQQTIQTRPLTLPCISAVAFDEKNGTLYFADQNGLRKVNAKSGNLSEWVRRQSNLGSFDLSSEVEVSTVYSVGGFKRDLIILPNGNLLYTDSTAHTIEEYDFEKEELIRFAGTSKGLQDGSAEECAFNQPSELICDPQRMVVFITDTYNHCIRMIDQTTKVVSTVAGNGVSGSRNGKGTQAQFRFPRGLCLDSATGDLYVSEAERVRKIDKQWNVTDVPGFDKKYNTARQAINLDWLDIRGMDWDLQTKHLFAVDHQRNRVRMHDVSTGIGIILAGHIVPGSVDGDASEVKFHDPESVALDVRDRIAYVAGGKDGRVRAIVMPLPGLPNSISSLPPITPAPIITPKESDGDASATMPAGKTNGDAIASDATPSFVVQNITKEGIDPELSRWLASQELTELGPIFMLLGVETMKDFRFLKEEDLENANLTVIQKRKISKVMCDMKRSSSIQNFEDLTLPDDAQSVSSYGSFRESMRRSRSNSSFNNLTNLLPLPPTWHKDSDHPQCEVCRREFSLFLRRHHCRKCGGVVCAYCSETKIPLPQFGIFDPVRVCGKCAPGVI